MDSSFAQRRNLGEDVHARLVDPRRALPRRADRWADRRVDICLGQAGHPLYGGAGRLFRDSTNPKVATGDGHALAYRAGAEIRDLEFMQFHPTVLYIAGSSRSLITEAIRGEGGRLVDCHGERFMTSYDPRGDLAPRDVVSQSIVSQMEKTNRHAYFST